MTETIDFTARLTRIRFQNETNSYTVADCTSEDTGTPITVVGFLMGVREGDVLCLKGSWEKHPRYGQRFSVKSFEPLLPTTIEEIRHFLKSLGVEGLGTKKIRALIDRFGEKTLEFIENNNESIAKTPGIGDVLSKRIQKAWDMRNDVRKLMIFLQSNNIPSLYSSVIHAKYGADAVEIISRTPYSVYFDIPAIPFSVIDSAAINMGTDRNSPERVSACIYNVLNISSSSGHVCVLEHQLEDQCSVKYGIDNLSIAKAMEKLASGNMIVIEKNFNNTGFNAVYTRQLYDAEVDVTNILKELAARTPDTPHLNRSEIIEAVLESLAIELSDEQAEVLDHILSHRVVLITGGPGTGKTTLVRSVATIFKRLDKTVLLAAPTGRAARRLSEVTEENASTIHKMLQYNVGTESFDKNRNNPLDADAVIIDEASMVDLLLMQKLLSAIPPEASVIMVGDIFQLPSVGPGTVLADLIHSERFRTFELTKIFRQAKESPIILNSHRIRYGKPLKIPDSTENKGLSEFYFIETANPATVVERVVELCKSRIPLKYGFDPINDIQVLTPMHKGEAGTINLNSALQTALNPDDTRGSFASGYKKGDKVMHLKNNYEKEVYNGEIGIVDRIDSKKRVLTVDYDGNIVEYDSEELNELTLAYAISVHKSQGSEYPAIVVPVTTQHYPMLQRNLLYTAITRGKQLVILIGTKKALSIALENDQPKHRLSGLKIRLEQL